jgi:glycosyl transferase family 87
MKTTTAPSRSQILRVGLLLLAVAAAVNIGAGVTLALRDPRRASDLRTMVEWGRDWLLGGRSLYAGADAFTDYPPNAIVWLSPLALVSERWVVPLWTAVALALTPVMPWLVMRCASPAGVEDGVAFASYRRSEALIAPTLLYLCWAAPRTLLQFSLLSMTLASTAMVIADSRWLASGLLLGVALFKPHIAGPFGLWMLVTGRVRSFFVAMIVVALGVAMYDVRVMESPLVTAAGWGGVIGRAYGGMEGLVGHMSIRAWVNSAIEDPSTAGLVWLTLSAALLIALCGLALRDPSRALDDGGMAIPAMFGMWSLLTIYHNGNNMILMLPAFAFLWFRTDRRTSPSYWIALAALQVALAFDVPVRLSSVAPSLGWARLAIEHVDRVLVLATLVWVSVSWYRLTTATQSGGR